MGARRSTARTSNSNYVSIMYAGKKFYLYTSFMLNFHNGKTLFSDKYDKSHLYSLCKKMAKLLVQTGKQGNSFHVFKYQGVWYQSSNILETETTKVMPSLEDQDFYKEAIK